MQFLYFTVHRHLGKLSSTANGVIRRAVDGPSVCHIEEVSQKEKNKYCTLGCAVFNH